MESKYIDLIKEINKIKSELGEMSVIDGDALNESAAIVNSSNTPEAISNYEDRLERFKDGLHAISAMDKVVNYLERRASY